MSKEIYDKILDELISEAVQNCEIDDENDSNSEVVFSKEHTEKMNKLFNEMKRKEKLDRILRLSKKVAIIIVVLGIVMVVTTPKISAWKEVIKKFFVKEEDKYSWIVYNDPDRVEDFNTGLNEEDKLTESGDVIAENTVDFLGYIPILPARILISQSSLFSSVLLLLQFLALQNRF